VLLPVDASAAQYADAIVNIMSQPERYLRLARNSFKEFAQRLNWGAWINGFIPRVEAMLSSPRPVGPAGQGWHV
jgi:hypothetical protein